MFTKLGRKCISVPEMILNLFGDKHGTFKMSNKKKKNPFCVPMKGVKLLNLMIHSINYNIQLTLNPCMKTATPSRYRALHCRASERRWRSIGCVGVCRSVSCSLLLFDTVRLPSMMENMYDTEKDSNDDGVIVHAEHGPSCCAYFEL